MPTNLRTLAKPPPLTRQNDPLRRQAEAEMLFMSIGDGATTTDQYGRITRINQAALKILGYRQSDLIGTWFPRSLPALSIDGKPMAIGDRFITKAFLSGEPISGRMIYLTKQGNQVPCYVSVSPIMVRGQPIGAIEVFRDISMELEVDKMKSEFISLASHQLRTPLSAIKTYTHMLYEGYMGELNNNQKEALDTIIGASNRMNELISMLLNITRIESGSIAVNNKVTDLEACLSDLIPELSLMADAKNITVSFQLVGKFSTQIKTDILILKEVITNLVSNAIKYSSHGGEVKITMRPRRRDIVIEVSDSGWGIPKQMHEKVFSKFFRGPNIIKRETSGTGLGLYLVKGLVDVLKGKVWFESEEGVGSSFYISLPRAGRPKAASQ